MVSIFEMNNNNLIFIDLGTSSQSTNMSSVTNQSGAIPINHDVDEFDMLAQSRNTTMMTYVIEIINFFFITHTI